MVTTTPIYIHNIHHHNDIFNINISSHLISMSLSISTSSHLNVIFNINISSHLNVIININIISSQCHFQHQHHLISMKLPTPTSSHFNIIINNSITSCHIIINNIILISILSPITTSNQNLNAHFRFIKSYYTLERHDEVTLFTFNKHTT